MTPVSSVTRVLNLSVSIAVLAIGCGGQKRPVVAAVGQASVAAGDEKLTDDLHARLVADAHDNYTPGPRKDAITLPNGSLDHGGAVAGITVFAQKMERNTNAGPEIHQFVALFVSDRKYKRLGLGEKENYVLMFPHVGDTIYVMVPSDLKASMQFLNYDKHFTFYHMPHDAPQVVQEVAGSAEVQGVRVNELVIGGCVEGPCPTNHCGLSGASNAFMINNYRELIQRAQRR
jgi:hypothetical protein